VPVILTDLHHSGGWAGREPKTPNTRVFIGTPDCAWLSGLSAWFAALQASPNMLYIASALFTTF
jgi:hypothetical protein